VAFALRCLIFASDGLWNVIDPEFAVECVYETERQNDQNARLGNNTWQNPSRILVESALGNWKKNNLRADNTSVVCVMLDPPNKKNLFKFDRNARNDYSSVNEQGVHAIFDYSTSEAYNLDFMDSDIYQNTNLPRTNPLYEAYSNQSSFYDLSSQQTHSSGYNHYQTSYGYQLASTSSQHQSSVIEQASPAPLTYQASTNENALVKACCRNNYLLASPNEHIPYHSSYEQHREMYENMALKPYPPLHYAYRPIPMSQIPLPSLHTNIYGPQNYVPSPQNYKPMERYNYLRPTPEELAAMHNEEDEDEDSSDTSEMSDSEDDENECVQQVKAESPQNKYDGESRDDSIQIFEISSSHFSENEKASVETGHSSDGSNYKKKPGKSNNKENSDDKKKAAPTGRFYATRQTDRKMRSSNTPRTASREKLHRRITRNIRKTVKTLADQKSNATRRVELLADTTRSSRSTVKPSDSKSVEKPACESNKPLPKSKEQKRSAQLKEKEANFKKQLSDTITVRSLRSNSSHSNVVKKPATRKRPPAFAENTERVREKRFK
jgi:hypothetical protein